MVPEFEALGRTDIPSCKHAIGQLRGGDVFTERLCFHYTHPVYLERSSQNETTQQGDQLCKILKHSGASLSPIQDNELNDVNLLHLCLM